MQYTMKKLSDLNEEQIEQATKVFVDCFYEALTSFISKDKEKLYELFKSALVRDMVYICLNGDEIAGFLGLSNNKTGPVKSDVEVCQKLFGEGQGKTVCKYLGVTLEKIHVSGDDEAHIDFVAPGKNHQSEAVAAGLVNYLFENSPYKRFLIDVFSKNTEAISVYEKLGFKKQKANFSPLSMMSGMGKPLVMVKEI